jgi:hypothetical protein
LTVTNIGMSNGKFYVSREGSELFRKSNMLVANINVGGEKTFIIHSPIFNAKDEYLSWKLYAHFEAAVTWLPSLTGAYGAEVSVDKEEFAIC